MHLKISAGILLFCQEESFKSPFADCRVFTIAFRKVSVDLNPTAVRSLAVCVFFGRKLQGQHLVGKHGSYVSIVDGV